LFTFDEDLNKLIMKENQPAVRKFIDPLLDFSFKRIFGTEPNKDLLIALLNGIFRGRKHIVDLLYNKHEHVGDTAELGSVLFDLTCTSTSIQPQAADAVLRQ